MKTKVCSFLFAFLILCGCTKNISDKTIEINDVPKSEVSVALPICPDGYHAVLSYDFDHFSFHRPKKNCESGFWFCFSGGGWHTNCEPDRPVSFINGTSAFVWAQELSSGQIEIHFPLALKTTDGYSATDLETFNVDEEYEIYEGITLKIGDYPVIETTNELVVVVDTI